jgi:NAD-dependent deacetylase
VALTGAGISTSVGIPDFRGPQGIYVTRRYPPEVFDIELFDQDPRGFFNFARDFLGTLDRLVPSPTHRLLATLEGAGRLHAVVTQNIDGLHQRAGNRRVIEVHGGFERSFCRACHAERDLAFMRDLLAHAKVPSCPSCGGIMKPDIVFFGEPVKRMVEAELAVLESDLLLVIGTSLTVFPAASLPDHAGGEVVVVTRGEVAGPRRPALRVDADIDDFFLLVESRLPNTD